MMRKKVHTGEAGGEGQASALSQAEGFVYVLRDQDAPDRQPRVVKS